MYGKGITNYSRFVDRALSCIREFMEDDGQESAYGRFIAPASGSTGFAKAFNRSVSGSMNDMIKFAKLWRVGRSQWSLASMRWRHHHLTGGWRPLRLEDVIFICTGPC